MARLKVSIDNKLMAKVSASVEVLWPGQGAKTITRFVQDAIRRYLRYWNGKHKH